MELITTKIYPVDSSLFNPEQLQTRTILSLGMNNSWEWLSRIGVSFPRFITDFGQGMVVLGVELKHLKPLRFLDAPTLEVRTMPVRISRQGLQLEFEVDFYANDNRIASLGSICAVLKLAGDEAFGASPGRLLPTLVEAITGGHINKSPRKIDPSIVIGEFSNTEPLAEHIHGFRIYRHQCEVADQWSFIEVAAWVSEARESLLLKSSDADLRKILSQPLKRFITRYARPMYFRDVGEIRCRAYRKNGETLFCHDIKNLTQGTTAAITLEVF